MNRLFGELYKMRQAGGGGLVHPNPASGRHRYVQRLVSTSDGGMKGGEVRIFRRAEQIKTDYRDRCPSSLPTGQAGLAMTRYSTSNSQLATRSSQLTAVPLFPNPARCHPSLVIQDLTVISAGKGDEIGQHAWPEDAPVGQLQRGGGATGDGRQCFGHGELFIYTQ